MTEPTTTTNPAASAPEAPNTGDEQVDQALAGLTAHVEDDQDLPTAIDEATEVHARLRERLSAMGQ